MGILLGSWHTRSTFSPSLSCFFGSCASAVAESSPALSVSVTSNAARGLGSNLSDSMQYILPTTIITIEIKSGNAGVAHREHLPIVALLFLQRVHMPGFQLAICTCFQISV